MCEREENRPREGTGQRCLSALKWPLLQPEASGDGVGGRALPVARLMSAFSEETRALMRCMQRAQAARAGRSLPSGPQNLRTPEAAAEGFLCPVGSASPTTVVWGEP